MTNVIQLPRMMRDAEVRAASFREDHNTIEVIWTTGAIGRRISWSDGEFDEELIVTPKAVRLDRLNAGAPFLDTHSRFDLGDVLGSVVAGTARIEGGKGLATVKLSGAADVADRVTKIREGVVRNISVGYRIYAVEKKERSGQVPLHRVIDWEPSEISAVPVPFDFGAQVRSMGGDALYSCRVQTSLEDQNFAIRTRMEMRMRQAMMA